jgi:pimeloyl-ACP methyl ester carboxylesterase
MSHSANINGFAMHYDIRGTGAPLLLLHGFTGAGSDWQYLFPQPPSGFELIVPDLRGHGSSTNPPAVFTFRQAAQDILGLLDHLTIDRIKAIGLSAGAKVLLHTAVMRPGRIQAMVLVSAAPYFPEEARTIMRSMTPDNHSEEEWQMMRIKHKHGDEQIKMLWRQAHEFKDSFDDMNLTPHDISLISARTLIVHGDRDPFYPPEIALRMHQSIPGSSLWLIPNAGHAPVFGERAVPFVEKALVFLRR